MHLQNGSEQKNTIKRHAHLVNHHNSTRSFVPARFTAAASRAVILQAVLGMHTDSLIAASARAVHDKKCLADHLQHTATLVHSNLSTAAHAV
jgi:hypothetical protein